MPRSNKPKVKKTKKISQTIQNLNQKKDRRLILTEITETEEYEIKEKATLTKPEKKMRFPKEREKRYQMMPDDFADAQNAIEAYQNENREMKVYSTSLESYLGYDSLLRVMGKHFGQMVAYYRSEAGGSLTLEEARKEVYRQNITDDEAIKLFDELMRLPADFISFNNLMELNDNSPAMAQNLWEMIKREAGREFESGHRAAAAFEPADYMMDAWNRASYLGLRESLIEEWQPKGGVELTMIDTVAQAWLMLQHWTEQSVRRSKTQPRQENNQFYEWKKWQQQANPKQWVGGFWDVPYVSEQQAVEHAAQMADRWQRMYFRAIRNLRDWRRYTPQLTINNAKQVNIATDSGQQINVSNSKEDQPK